MRLANSIASALERNPQTSTPRHRTTVSIVFLAVSVYLSGHVRRRLISCVPRSKLAADASGTKVWIARPLRPRGPVALPQGQQPWTFPPRFTEYGVMAGEILHYVLRFRSSQPPLSSNAAVQRCCAHLPASPMPIGVILCPQFHCRTPYRRLNCGSTSTLIPFDLGPLCSHQAIKPASASKIWAISGQLPCPPAVG